MGRNKQLRLYNVRNMLTQESYIRGSPETKCKLLYKVAGFLAQTNCIKHMNNALDYYNKIHDLMSSSYGEQHPRSYNALLKIVQLEKKISNCKLQMKKQKNKNE